VDWINVAEALPSNNDDVILWLGGSGHKLWDTGWYRYQDESWIDSRDEVCYPTHYARVTQPISIGSFHPG
jgi:hypothetical protein